jgi:periplasmic divalent cation tolerance protein
MQAMTGGDRMDEPILVLITTPNEAIARQIAFHLVEQRLAACVNRLPAIQSIYRWEGAVQEDQEILLLCKTRRSLLDPDFIEAVRALHPYELPEIIAMPIEGGLGAYLEWIVASTRPKSSA